MFILKTCSEGKIMKPQSPYKIPSQFRRLFMHHRLQTLTVGWGNKGWCMENLLSSTNIHQHARCLMLNTERGIQAAVFILLIVGLFSVSGWLSYYYFITEIPLLIASVALSWGIILLLMYVIFRKLNWRWWE